MVCTLMVYKNSQIFQSTLSIHEHRNLKCLSNAIFLEWPGRFGGREKIIDVLNSILRSYINITVLGSIMKSRTLKKVNMCHIVNIPM